MKQAPISLIVEHNNAFDKREYIIFPSPTQAQNLTKKISYFMLQFNIKQFVRHQILHFFNYPVDYQNKKRGRHKC